IIESLIRHGVDLEARDLNGLTPLLSAAEAGNSKTVKILVQIGASLRTVDYYGEGAMHWAATSGDRETLQFFIDQFGVAKINTKDDKGDTPLHHAVENGKITTVELLVENGAYVNALNKENVSPISKSPYNWNFNIVKILLDNGANPNEGSLS